MTIDPGKLTDDVYMAVRELEMKFCGPRMSVDATLREPLIPTGGPDSSARRMFRVALDEAFRAGVNYGIASVTIPPKKKSTKTRRDDESCASCGKTWAYHREFHPRHLFKSAAP